MSLHGDRLTLLRDAIDRLGLDGLVLPRTDEHLSEYIGGYAERLAWLTGFDGTAGTAVILRDEAAVFVDGRYTLQLEQQADPRLWRFERLSPTAITEWLSNHAAPGAKIGFDPWLHPWSWERGARQSLATSDIQLVAVDRNPLDALWHDRPAPSDAPIFVHPIEHAGLSSAAKREAMAATLAGLGADTVILSALDSIAWTFNLRGRDIGFTPVALAFAAVDADGSAALFVAPGKVDAAVREHLGEAVTVHDRADFASWLGRQSRRRIALDPVRTVSAIASALLTGGATLVEATDPAVLPKAIKNATEIAGARNAHVRDGAALVRFLHWLSLEAPKGGLTEIGAADRALQFRRETGALHDLSFGTISGAGPTGAIVHHRVTPANSKPFVADSLYLVDTGGQYADGTTDVTRTIGIGAPPIEMRRRYTQVLKGHVAMARAVFPEGTCGHQIDAFARQFLWAAGVDYPHGTGHGVGAFLAVHEGPQRIASNVADDAPLMAGMIVSNEPGYYKPGAYGIRIENLMLVEQRPIAGAEHAMLGFDTLTLAPFDRSLIMVDLLSADERAWIDSYHARVADQLGPLIEAPPRVWLEKACAPLATAAIAA